MRITVDIPDEFVAQAKARGLTPEDYVKTLVEDAGRNGNANLPPSKPKMDIQTFIRGMASFSEKIPQLPHEAYTRESFYQDHD
jgi:hypothetical protein